MRRSDLLITISCGVIAWVGDGRLTAEAAPKDRNGQAGDGIVGQDDLVPADLASKFRIRNAGFEETQETNGARVPKEWESRSQPMELTDRSTHAGAWCLRLPKRGQPRLFVEQQVMLPEEGWYTLTVWARTDAVDLAAAQLVVFGQLTACARPDPKQPEEVPISRYAPGRAQSDELPLTTEWQPLAVAFLAKDLKFVVRLEGWVWSGSVYFDDARIAPTEVKPKGADTVPAIPLSVPTPTQYLQPSPTVPGKPVVDPPTYACLGFQWPIDGDWNRNGRVEVRYRKSGATEWRQGQDLLRVMHERINRDIPERDWVCPNRYAGSLVDLDSGTEYEVRLNLIDPDGGSAEESLRVSTRPEVPVFQGERQLHLYPGEVPGQALQPAFTTLKAAYEQARPGDVILVHAGRYVVPESAQDQRRAYVLNKDGTPEKPIVIRAAGDGPAVFDGEGAVVLFDLTGADDHHFEGIVAQDADRLFQSSANRGLIVRHCRLEDSAYPVFATEFCRDFTISDNTILGNLPDGAFHPQMKGMDKYGHGVWIYGQGHVIRHNRVKGFWDGIDTCGYYLPPDDASRWIHSIDIHNNLISDCVDDGIELDYSVHNVRAFRNFIYNTGKMGISTQPVYGGPAYIFRNVIFNSNYYPFKLNNWPAGVLIYHNTALVQVGFRAAALWQNCRILNNLFLGNDTHGDGGLWTGTPTPETSRLDYNGYRNNRPERAILWEFFRPYRYDNTATAFRLFAALPEFAKATGYEEHGLWGIDYDIFAWAQPPSGGATPLPELDLRLTEGSRVIDAAAVLANFNDGYTGKAPDMGALEFGTSVPVYGPRQPEPGRTAPAPGE